MIYITGPPLSPAKALIECGSMRSGWLGYGLIARMFAPMVSNCCVRSSPPAPANTSFVDTTSTSLRPALLMASRNSPSRRAPPIQAVQRSTISFAASGTGLQTTTSTRYSLPPGPALAAAINESVPPPQPRSKTMDPAGISAKTDTLDTPVNLATEDCGRLRNSSAG